MGSNCTYTEFINTPNRQYYHKLNSNYIQEYAKTIQELNIEKIVKKFESEIRAIITILIYIIKVTAYNIVLFRLMIR